MWGGERVNVGGRVNVGQGRERVNVGGGGREFCLISILSGRGL